MSQSTYLIALALIEQSGKRAMPLGGKSVKHELKSNIQPNDIGQTLVTELLIRIFQKSEVDNIKRAAGHHSLLLVQIDMEIMQSNLPIIKSEWIHSGDTEQFIAKLVQLSENVWHLRFTKYEGIQFLKCH